MLFIAGVAQDFFNSLAVHSYNRMGEIHFTAYAVSDNIFCGFIHHWFFLFLGGMSYRAGGSATHEKAPRKNKGLFDD